MCIGTPAQLLSCDGLTGTADLGNGEESIDLALLGPMPVGTWVLCFLGTAREVLDEDEARKILAALDGLRAVMAGGSLGDAFADLDQRAPSLPPHLAAAAAAGKHQA